MKQIYIVIFLFCTSFLGAQTACTFDDSEVDTLGVVSPSPYHETENPDGGIDKDACINEPYEFNFIIIVPATAPGFPIPIDSVTLRGEGIIGLPDGLSYETNTENDVFYPLKADCITINGIPSSSNMPGDYELEILVSLHLAGLGSQDFKFPDPAITGDGKYIITLKEEGSCSTSNDESKLDLGAELTILNNPVATDLNISLHTKSYKEGTFELISMFGQRILETRKNLLPGDNSIKIDVRNVNQGIYFIKYRDENSEITKRIHIVNP